jgi:hypothetical protein
MSHYCIVRGVLSKCDDIAASLVLPTASHPHKKARRSKAAQHFLHLCEAIQDWLKSVRNVTRICFIICVIVMAVVLKDNKVRKTKRITRLLDKVPHCDT